MTTLARITLGRLVPPGSGGGGLLVAGFVGATVDASLMIVTLVPGVNAGVLADAVRAIVSPDLSASVGAPPIAASLYGPIVAEVD
jgi:hypothetical protein